VIARQPLRAATVYLLIQGLGSARFATAFTLSAIYRSRSAGLDPFRLILLGTALETAAFLFEVPTGVVADAVSRRLSVIIGYGLIGVGVILEGSLPVFATILVAQVVWASATPSPAGPGPPGWPTRSARTRPPSLIQRGHRRGRSERSPGSSA